MQTSLNHKRMVILRICAVFEHFLAHVEIMVLFVPIFYYGSDIKKWIVQIILGECVHNLDKSFDTKNA